MGAKATAALRTALLVLALVAMLIGAAAAAYRGWFGLGEVDIGVHGVLALALGAMLSLVVGVGLMWLVFYSSRSGRDNIADWQPRHGRDGRDDPR